MPEIHVDSLVKQFGEQRALDDVSFHVEDGELLTLLGPSGCGKATTLMSIGRIQTPDAPSGCGKSTPLMSIAGFQTPEEGRVAVGGDVFFDAARRVSVPAERRNLGIVFQSYAVWPHM